MLARFKVFARRVVSAVSSLVTAGTDSFFRNVSLLVNSTSDISSQNITVIDSSPNLTRITRVSPATQGTFSPFSSRSWSNFFDGTGDYLSVPGGAQCTPGTGDFTWEAWVYPTSFSSDLVIYDGRDGVGQDALNIRLVATTGVFRQGFSGSSIQVDGVAVSLNTWTHLAITRSGTTLRLFQNGVITQTVNDNSIDITNGTNRPIIGASGYVLANNPFIGYISNLRLIKGTALYTSNFTSPTAPLTAIANTSLLTCQSNRFIDASTNNFTITRNGDVSVQSYTPFSPTDVPWRDVSPGWSNFFDGTNSYIQFPNNAAFEIGTGDLTVEAWIYLTGYSPAYNEGFRYAFIMNKDVSGSRGWSFGLNGTASSWTAINFGIFSSNFATFGPNVNYNFSLNTWYHVAATRLGNSFRIYVNGIDIGGTTSSSVGQTPTSGALEIGAESPSWQSLGYGYYFPGYISNARIVKGTAVYTSNFTPSTAPLTAVANTVLLTCQSDRFIDNGPNRFSAVRAGNARIDPFGPFGPYSQNVWSNTFDGTGDFLTVPQNAAFNFSTAPFTVEGWVYLTAYPSGGSTALMSLGDGAVGSGSITYSGWALTIGSTGTVAWYRFDGTEYNYVSSATISLNRWTHLAAVRDSANNLAVFMNGSRVVTQASATLAYDNVNSNPLYIGNWKSGASPGTNRSITGFVHSCRIVKGTAVYDPTQTTISPPTSILTAIANTSLLTCHSTNFVDSSNNNFTVTRNGDVSVTALNPYGAFNQTVWSGYFDGSTSYLSVPDNAAFLLTGDFTVEAWVYQTSSKQVTVLGQWGTAGNTSFIWRIDSTGQLSFGYKLSGGSEISSTASTSAIPYNTWTHVAWVRIGSTIYYYINGIQDVTTNTVSGSFNDSTAGVLIGLYNTVVDTYFNGYISNLRLVNGTAVYTSNFTPPTAPLTPIANTSLLTCQNSTLSDLSTNNFTVTKTGAVTSAAFSPFPPFTQTAFSNYFDGSGDFLSAPASTAWVMSGDFTMECWFNITGESPLDANNSRPFVLFRNGTQGNIAFQFLVGGSSTTTGTSLSIFRSNDINAGPAYTFVKNEWYHVALTRVGTLVTFYVNGVSVSTTNISGSIGSSSYTMEVGGSNPASQPSYNNTLNGYISDARIVNGTAVYRSNFTPPKAPLVPITNTSLLVCNAPRNIDRSDNNFTITRGGNVSLSTYSPLSPFTTPANNRGSLRFNDSGYVQVQSTSNMTLGTSNSTVEFWVYPTTIGTQQTIYDGRVGSLGAAAPVIVIENTGAVTVYIANGIQVMTTAASLIVAGMWSHVAWVRSGSNYIIYINGTSVQTSVNVQNYSAVTATNIGVNLNVAAPFTGFISDLRVVKNYAVYTGNFTPPTSPLTSIPGTVLLLSGTNYGAFDSTTINPINTVGDAQVNSGTARWGTNSVLFDGNGDNLSIPHNPALNLATGDFTIDGWVYWNGNNSAATVIVKDGVFGSSNPSYAIAVNGSGYLKAVVGSGNGVTYAQTITSNTLLPTNNWIYFAFVKSGTSLALYQNGNQVAAATQTGTIIDGGKPVLIGYDTGQPASTYFSGYIDDIRVTKGVARYGTILPTATSDNLIDTTLLLKTSSTTGIQNYTFLDSSPNNFTITRNGDTTQGTFSPFASSGWSNYFDGNGDWLTLPHSASYPTGTQAMTIEAWFYVTALSVNQGIVAKSSISNTNFAIYINASNQLIFTSMTGSITGPTVVANRWYHVAITNNGTGAAGSTTMWLNGVSVGTGLVSLGSTVNSAYIGAFDPSNGSFTWPFNGYISNVRIVTSQVYTTTFTPPTTPLTAITNTVLLTCQNNRFIDNSTNAFAITRSGDVKVEAYSPFSQSAQWSAATNGASGYFDGSGDYLTVPAGSSFAYGTGDFTVEGWFNCSSLPAYIANLFSQTVSGTNYFVCALGDNNLTPARKVSFFFSTSGTGTIVLSGTTEFQLNSWNHFAIVRSSGFVTCYLNGVGGTPVSCSQDFTNTTYVPTIGRYTHTEGYNFTGYLANLRVVKGTAVYTANFTPPTAPVTSIANTQLLLDFTNSGIYDNSMKRNTFYPVGGAASSSVSKQWGSTSIVLPGNGYVQFPATDFLNFGTGDFAIDFWMNPGGQTFYAVIADGPNLAIECGAIISSRISFSVGGKQILSPSAPSGWTHVALVKSFDTAYMYINGVLQNSTGGLNTTLSHSLSGTRLGKWTGNGLFDNAYVGYIQDFRVTRGRALFTPTSIPTLPFGVR